ncbi:transcriptional regulator with XRE-family HTH domain [Herbaspirillum rubrisubalbicans]|uniref:helix-turn-helix domain-containing protein n=1 Tax=Herbaspirillum rubrisubalbicans TaxID=80842 RepID=UPI00209DFE8D|nr:helix-turn-helix transcriptional regulator [Herbaspirillum rubrisubalbicans]MCP1574171.1 transcriptional regulator with XRE-family HTH domain [Herbaspirillum rubrisubalbicans]
MDLQADDVAKAAGKVLRHLRKDAGLTQEKLSFKAAIQRNFVSEIELGLKQPSLFTIFKLAQALEVAPQNFVQLIQAELNSAA